MNSGPCGHGPSLEIYNFLHQLHELGLGLPWEENIHSSTHKIRTEPAGLRARL